MFLSVLDSPQSSIYRLEPTSLWQKCFEHIRKCYLYAKECHDSRSMKNAAKGDAAAFLFAMLQSPPRKSGRMSLDKGRLYADTSRQPCIRRKRRVLGNQVSLESGIPASRRVASRRLDD